MSLKKIVGGIAGAAGDIWGELTGAAGTERAQQQAARDLMSRAREGAGGLREAFGGAESRLQPFLMGGVDAQRRLSQELLGNPTATANLPGYSSMLSARREGLEDLAMGKAGLGQLFSGRTAEQASDLSGSMEQQLRNLFMGQLAQQAGQGANIGQFLGGQQMGMAGNIANLLMGGQTQASGYNVGAAQTSQANMGDMFDTIAQIGGMLAGGGAGAGGAM